MAQAGKQAEFLNYLEYEEIPRSRIIRLTDDFKVYSAVIGRTITVPNGFTCDGESVFFKSSTEAGVVHDYLYRKDSDPIVSRKIADEIFYEMSLLDDCWMVVCLAKWLVVRTVAGRFYHKLKVADIPEN